MPEPAPPQPVQHSFRLGIIGFYLSCAGVALGTAIGAAGFLWFRSIPALVIGIAMLLVCAVTCFRSLRTARR